MFFSKLNMKRLTLCGSLLAIAGSTIGFAPSATAIPSAFYQRTNQDSPLVVADNTRTPILVQVVPAGRYVINYSASVLNTGIIETTRCGVLVNGREISNHLAVVGLIPTQIGSNTISGVAVTRSNVPLTIQLACSHDGGGNGVPVVQAGAELAIF